MNDTHTMRKNRVREIERVEWENAQKAETMEIISQMELLLPFYPFVGRRRRGVGV